MNSIMTAFKGIEIMLKEEVKSLEEAIIDLPTGSAVEEKETLNLQKKVRNIGDLSKTMGGLMRNIIHEV